MKGKYTRQELLNRNDSRAEKERLRGIYEDLVKRASAGYYISAIEQEHIYAGVNFLEKNIADFPFVEDAHFKHTYLTYFQDITGGSSYVKARNGRIIEVPRGERDSDLAYLIAAAEKWEKVLQPGMHSDQLLQEIAKETKKEKKDLDLSLNISGNPYLQGSYFYLYKLWQTFLRSRFLYLMAKEIMEETKQSDLTYSFCGETIEFTEFSLIHILNRHFAEITKQFVSGKDYHPEDIKPRILTGQIKQIVETIDKSGFLSRQIQTEINLRYNGTIYQLWASWQNRSIKGQKGAVRYKRLQSFYPVSSAGVLEKLSKNYKELIISKELSVFVPI